jgi:hypothetical protein
VPPFRGPEAHRLRLGGARGGFRSATIRHDFVVAFERIDGALAQRIPGAARRAFVGRPVDLVMEGSVRNPFIQAGIERSAETIYGTMPCYIITAYVPDPALWESDFGTRKPQ